MIYGTIHHARFSRTEMKTTGTDDDLEGWKLGPMESFRGCSFQVGPAGHPFGNQVKRNKARETWEFS